MKKLLILLFIPIILAGCSIKSTDDYYKEKESSGKLTASILINCQTAVDYKDGDREKAEILPKTSVSFDKGESVFDVLRRICKQKKIQFEYKGSADSVYIEGIDYLYEFNCGSLSGWEYSVNGKFPSVGCASYKLSDGDEIRWLYTCELGADIGDKYKGDSND